MAARELYEYELDNGRRGRGFHSYGDAEKNAKLWLRHRKAKSYRVIRTRDGWASEWKYKG